MSTYPAELSPIAEIKLSKSARISTCGIRARLESILLICMFWMTSSQFLVHARWHTVEQIVISYFFERTGRLIPAEKYIFHYWFYRPTLGLLKYFFNGDMSTKDNLFVEFFGIEKEEDKPKYQDLPRCSMQLFISFSEVYDWHLYSLPRTSYPGRFLRAKLLKTRSSAWFFFQCWYRDLLNRNEIKEIVKPQFKYE